MAPVKTNRRIRRTAAALLSLALLALATYPLWFSWLLRPAAARLGAAWSGTEHAGFNRLRLTQFALTNGPVVFQANTLELALPHRWLWQCLFPSPNHLPVLEADQWLLTIQPASGAPPSPPPNNPPSVDATVRALLHGVPSVAYWVPRVRLGPGRLQAPGLDLSLRRLWVAQAQLGSDFILPGVEQPARLRLLLADPATTTAHFVSQPLKLHGRVRLSPNTHGLTLDGVLARQGNRLHLHTHFNHEGTLPTIAEVTGSNWTIDPNELGLDGFNALRASLHAQWVNERFSFNAQARAEPAPGSPLQHPLDVAISATGNRSSVRVDEVRMVSPWAQARLSQPLELPYTPPETWPSPAEFTLEADLDRQTLLPISGKVAAKALLTPAFDRIPKAVVEMTCSDLATTLRSELPPCNFEAAATLNWPNLELRQMTATFPDGSEAQVHATLDLGAAAVQQGTLRLSAGPRPPGLPAEVALGDFDLRATFHGPFTNLVHEGDTASSNLVIPHLPPIQLKASWAGQHLTFSNLSLGITAPENQIDLQASARLAKTSNVITIHHLSLASPAHEHPFRLDQPFTVQLTLEPELRFSLSPLTWGSGAAELRAQADVVWPDQGEFSLTAHHLPLSGFAPWFPPALSTVAIDRLHLDGNWRQGPIRFAASLDASAEADRRTGQSPPSATLSWGRELFPLRLTGHAEGGLDGIVISNLVLTSRSSVAATVAGRAPVLVHPVARSVELHALPDAAMNLTAEISPNTPLWSALREATGWAVTDPSVRLTLQGGWQNPAGQLQVRAAEIDARALGASLPRVSDLHLRLNFTPDALHLPDCRFRLEEQPVAVTARLPLAQGLRTLTHAHPLESLEALTASLLVDNASLAPLSRFDTNLLAPQGNLTARITLEPGLRWDGLVTVSDARTRPIPHVGPVRDIGFTLEFDHRDVLLRNAHGTIGTAPVRVEGLMHLPDPGQLGQGMPPFELKVLGENVPLSRSPEAIIRADLAVLITQTNDLSPLIHGAVTLRNSIVLSDLGSLVAGRVASPERRPPFFSIPNPPLGDFRLGLKVSGDRFLQARTPLFRGVASVNLDLGGTLREPVAVGQATVNEGVVRFPFASFKVLQGSVTLRSDNPYTPVLALTAESTQFSYDLRMDVSGPAHEPLLLFSSNPPLTSEQILLMVSAGELPRDERVLSNQQRAQTFALFLGRDLLARLGYADDAEPRLTLHSGEEITERGTPTYRVEYELAPRWTLTGEYDRFNEFNAGLRWRIYAK